MNPAMREANSPMEVKFLPWWGASDSSSSLSSGIDPRRRIIRASERERMRGEIEKKHPASANGLA